MNLEELVPAPNAEKVNKLAKRTFGYALDLDNISEAKAKALSRLFHCDMHNLLLVLAQSFHHMHSLDTIQSAKHIHCQQ